MPSQPSFHISIIEISNKEYEDLPIIFLPTVSRNHPKNTVFGHFLKAHIYPGKIRVKAGFLLRIIGGVIEGLKAFNIYSFTISQNSVKQTEREAKHLQTHKVSLDKRPKLKVLNDY